MYVTPRRKYYSDVSLDLTVVGQTGKQFYYNTGTWISALRLDNGNITLDAYQYRSAIDTDGNLIPFSSSTTGNTVGLRWVDPNGIPIVTVTTGDTVSGTAFTLKEFDTSRGLEVGSTLQVKIKNILSSGTLFNRVLFETLDQTTKFTNLFE